MHSPTEADLQDALAQQHTSEEVQHVQQQQLHAHLQIGRQGNMQQDVRQASP
jgi:hypothetical protein